MARDDRRAVALFRRAADAGDSRGQVHLAWMYLQGRGIDQDPAATVAWYRRAAERGAVDAQLNLAWHYQTGVGVTADPEIATAWLRRASGALGDVGEGIDR